MPPPLGRLTIYTHRIPEMVAFYCRHFGFEARPCPDPRMVELVPQGAGAAIRLHPAAKGQKMGQALVKLVFDAEDVDSFCREAAAKGLVFGKIHEGEGYRFANAKDPSGNSVCVSSAGFTTLSEERPGIDQDFLSPRSQGLPPRRDDR